METTHPITDPVQLQKVSEYLKEHNERDYMIFTMGINLGLRVSDFTTNTVGFYRDACEKGEVVLIPAKTSRYKKKVSVPISPDMKALILKYIDGKSDADYMFPSRKVNEETGLHEPITRQHIHRIITQATEAVGITENIGCHGMRKTFGYWHYKYNHNIRLLMEIFNHANEEVTLRYIGVTDEEKRKSMEFMNLGIIN